MYLLLLTLGQCTLYVLLAYVFSVFFNDRRPSLKGISPSSLGMITLISIFSYIVSFMVPDREWGNRVIHALGGGVTTFVVCFRVVKDFKIPLTRFQFFIFCALTVTAIRVGNEILEYFLQNYFNIMFAGNVNDTWLDLMSNTVGILLAGAALTPCIPSRHYIKNV